MILSKSKKVLLITAMIILAVFIAIMPFSKNNASAAIPDGQQAAVSGDTVTMYYLKLPTKNIPLRTTDDDLAAEMTPWVDLIWNVFEDAAMLTNNRYHTFIFTYNNIIVGAADAALLTTWNIECTTVGWGNLFGGHLTFYPKNDIEINIRSEYYELFQNGDFSDVTITYMFNGKGYKMTNPDNGNSSKYNLSGATLHTRQVAPDYDPIEIESQAPDNGGIALDPSAPARETIFETIFKNLSNDLDLGCGGGLSTLIVLIIVIIAAVLIVRYAKPKK